MQFSFISVDITDTSSQTNSSRKVTELSNLVNKMLKVFEPGYKSLKESWANIALQVKGELSLINN